MRISRSGAVILSALCLLSAAAVAQAEAISWRQTSVAAGRDGNAAVRRGVVIFGTGEPATMTVRLEPLSPPQDGRMAMRNDMSFRFEDGATLQLRATASVAMGADGRPARGENRSEGQVVGGTGRFQGATGTYRLRSRNDIDAMVDGALGDYFAVGEADIRLPPK